MQILISLKDINDINLCVSVHFLDVDVAIVRLLDLTYFGFWVYSNWVPLRHASKNFSSRISGEGM